jgi:hypothetical protein
MFQSEFIKAKHLTETLKKENQNFKVRIHLKKISFVLIFFSIQLGFI